ncbi:GntR family transcriptional regulator [Microbispora bryophytorum]|uniref:GntR family transcriptional regulator n=1 Tax=Microbispora bryophytorum TaxID=1460882 RepID=UPI0033E86477
MTVDQLDPRPLWEQLAAIIRDQIKAGVFEPRQVLPSEAHLQQEHGVARGTVRRAMAALAEQGWAVTIQGRGSFVAPRESWPEA